MSRRLRNAAHNAALDATICLVILAVIALACLAVSFPLGLWRGRDDAHWCKAFGHPTTRCLEARREARWGPFNAWGTNHSGGD